MIISRNGFPVSLDGFLTKNPDCCCYSCENSSSCGDDTGCPPCYFVFLRETAGGFYHREIIVRQQECCWETTVFQSIRWACVSSEWASFAAFGSIRLSYHSDTPFGGVEAEDYYLYFQDIAPDLIDCDETSYTAWVSDDFTCRDGGNFASSNGSGTAVVVPCCPGTVSAVHCALEEGCELFGVGDPC